MVSANQPICNTACMGAETRHLTSVSGWLRMLLLSAVLGGAFGLEARAAQNVGIAAAVLPQARSTQPEQAARVLRIGVDIVADERVVTDAKGKLQLLFLDGSALTVGPNSDVVVDEFVYDPKAQAGKLAFSATKGFFRLVGGKISKKTPVLLRTPQAVIGIRGGIVTARASEAGVTATFLFGDRMTVESGGQTVTADRPGFQIQAQEGAAPSPPVAANEQQISAELDALEGGGDQDEAVKVKVGDEDIAKTQLSALGSQEAPVTLAIPVTTIAPEPTDDIRAVDDNTDTTTAQQQKALVGTNERVGLTLSGFHGRGKRGLSTLTGTQDADATQNTALSNISIASGRFTADSSQGSYSLQGPAATGAFTLAGTNTTPYGGVSGVGILSADRDFLLYELSGSQQLIFAGVPTPNSAIPTSGVTSYDVRNDFTLGGSRVPLVPYNHGGNLSPGQAKATIYWGASGAGALPSFFSANLAFSGTGTAQKYAVSLLTGTIETDALGRPFLDGEGVALSLPSATDELYTYDGAISTQDADDGSDFFGQSGPNAAVLGSDEVDSNDNPVSRGVVESRLSVDTTIFPNIPLMAAASTPASLGVTRSTRVMAAYVGGISRDFDTSDNFLGAHKFYSNNTTSTVVVGGVTVPVNRIQTSAATNNVEAEFNVISPFSDGLPATSIDFGSLSTSNAERSAFIDDDHFGAIGFKSGASPTPDSGLFRNGDINLAEITPTGHTICTCSYVTWGFWGAEADSTAHHDIALAAWVAGERVANSSLHMGATGTYNGTLIATVANGAHDANGTVAIYTAIGSYSLAVSIGSAAVSVSSGTMNIDNASMTFSGSGTISGSTPTEFSATLTGSRGALSLSGSVRGAFFGTPATATSAPRNVAGFFAANDPSITYQVSGVHFSELQP